MANEAQIPLATESGQRLRALAPDDVAALLQVSHALQAHREGGAPLVFDSLEPLCEIDPCTHGMLVAAGMRSLAVLPLHAHGDCLGALAGCLRNSRWLSRSARNCH
jgi:hypothetical protein